MASAEHARKGACRHYFGPQLLCMNGDCTVDWFQQQANVTRCKFERPKEMGGHPAPPEQEEEAA